MFRTPLTAALVAGAIGALAPADVAAQIRPAYTKNVNEPGREPYNVSVEFTQSGCMANCANFFNFGGSVRLFDGPIVPAGKRLVVLSVSAELPSSSSINSISFQDSPILANQRAKWQFHGPFYASTPAGELWGMSAGTVFTVEPGQAPHIRLRLGAPNNFFASITIGGYLIDANN